MTLPALGPHATTILLLLASNVFMTFAWYGHLGGDNRPTWRVLEYVAELRNRPWFLAVLVSWGIAFVEYLFQVPANRIGSQEFGVAQLKIIQEVVTLGVFVPFSVWFLGQTPKLDYLWAGPCMIGTVYFMFRSA